MQPTVPPSAPEVEKHVLGGLLLGDGEANIAFERLKRQDFYLERHQVIFEALDGLYRSGRPMTLITIRDGLEAAKTLPLAGGEEYLMEVSSEVVSSANMEAHCSIIHEKAVRREYLSKAIKLLAAAQDPGKPNEEVSLLADTVFADMGAREERKGPVSCIDGLKGTIDLIEKCHRGEIQGLQTQFKTINAMTGGLCAPDWMVLSGRPGVGKTALALDISDYLATDCQKSVLFFSLEMTKEQLLQRVICRRQGVDFHLLRTGRLPREQFIRIGHAVQELKKSRLFIDDDPECSPGRILAIARRHQARYGLDLVVVDNLSLMEGDKVTENRLQEVSHITRNFKKHAKRLNVPIMTLVHFSRALESRGENTVPRKSDLRECGSIEQDADAIWGMHRPDPQDPKTDIYLLKQRNGPEGMVPLTADLCHMRFKNYEPAASFAT